MKKTMHAELIALAEQILNSNSSHSASDLKEKARELYERLTILSHLEQQIGIDPLTTPIAGNESLDSKSYREENWFKEPQPVEKPAHQDDIAEPLIEKIKDIVAQMPQETEQIDALLKDVLPPQNTVKNDLEDLAADYKVTPVFERKVEVELNPTLTTEEPTPATTNSQVEKAKSLNESLPAGTQIGLNDRLAFIKHLFENKPEDYARVLSQVDTMESFKQAKEFITGTVKPEYNYWINKEEYQERFFAAVEKRFN